MRAARPASLPLRLAVAALAGCVVASPAPAGEDADVREELRRTRELVESLQKRIADLEAKDGGAAAPAGIGKAVDEYLAGRQVAGANVSAPGARALRFSGHVVFWWERWDRAYRTGDPGGAAVEDIGWLRTSLQADADIAQGLTARIEIRDDRAFGEEPSTIAQLNGAGTGTDLKQGWFEAADFLGSGVTLRGGRMTLAYGDHRLVGDFEWHNYGRSFDGALLTRTFGRTRFDLFATRVMERGLGTVTPGVDDDDDDFFGLYTRTPGALAGGDLDLYLLGLRTRVDALGEDGLPGDTKFATLGARYAGGTGDLDWGAEGVLQRGHVAGDPLRAWAAHLGLGYTFADLGWQPRFGLEWNAATGDHDPTDAERQTFQNLFPTNHNHYGILDAMGWRNMRDVALGVRVKPAKDWTITATAHRFHLQDADDAWYAASGAPLRAGTAGGSTYVGTEFDLVFSHTVSEHLRVDFGGAQFWDGPFVRDTGSGGDGLWVYVRFTISF